MTTRFLRPTVGVIVLLAAVLAGARRADADVVTTWNAAALDAIRADKMPPPRASRALAILHAAVYDAVNGITRTHEPYLVGSDVPASASEEAAASAAAHVVLVALFPSHAATFDALHAATLAAIPDVSHTQQHKARGVAWGESVAQQILASRAGDNSGAAVAPPSGSGPGIWQPTPPAFAPYLLPQWGTVVPFAMPSSSFFRPNGPPALNSPTWAAAYNEVKAFGVAVGSVRTPDQDQIALFWADGGGTETPPGHWNSIAQAVATSAGNTLDENARLFALLNLAMADAAICAWDAKYAYDFWRPVTAIRNGDTDGNAATTKDATWSSFIVTPPFPEYVSGHSTFSGAAATVLAMFYGTDHVGFTAESDALPGVTRQFQTFSAAAHEAADSRLFGGIHYRFSNDDGLAGGIEIGEWTFAHFLRAKGNHGRK
jgi:hypothetical protein